MRIIAGKLGGRKLKAFKANHIRPTTDRVKESVFNRLSGYWEDARVLDLYSGTGNLSFESYSRGAEFVLSVEAHAKSIQIIKENKISLKIDSDIKVVKSDVFQFLKKYKSKPFQVILVDPPFTQKIAHSSMEAVAKSSVWEKNTVIVIESSSQERIDDKYDQLELDERKTYGDKIVSYFIALPS